MSEIRNQREVSSKQNFTQVSCLAYSSTLKMEATCSSETSLDFHWTTRRYIPEDRNHHSHDCENLVKHIFEGDCLFPFQGTGTGETEKITENLN
jgi:hypothetical protein